MDPFAIIDKWYPKGSKASGILKEHAILVAKKSLAIAKNLPPNPSHQKPDLAFIEKAAILHDIGICKTHAPDIGCTGEYPYICHGYLGREILDEEGLPEAFGKVAERHTGAGITLENIIDSKLPLPHRDMMPITLEERIICCADKFYSKSPRNQHKTKTIASIIASLGKINEEQAVRFAEWVKEFGLE